MRVHQTVIRAGSTKWQFPAVVGLLLVVLIYQVLKGPSNSADATGSGKTVNVIVATKPLAAGQPIPKESLALAARTAATVPSDALTNGSDVIGRVPVMTVPTGYVIGNALLLPVTGSADDKSGKKTQNAKEGGATLPVVDAASVLLERVSKGTVGISLNFQSTAPPRGTRIAISIQGKSGASEILADEAWVESSEKNAAQVRVAPPLALFLQDARNLGTFAYIVIPQEGESPFKGATQTLDINSLRDKLLTSADKQKEKQSKQVAERNAEKQKKEELTPGSFSSYAWINGEGVKYSIDPKGKIYVIDGSGAVTPLYDMNLPAPSSAVTPHSGKSTEVDEPAEDLAIVPHSQDEHGKVTTGLEPFFPLMGVTPLESAPDSKEAD